MILISASSQTAKNSLLARQTATMLYKGEKFAPSGFAEYLKLLCTILSAAAQIGLNIALAVLIGSNFRTHAPWAMYLVIALACAWTLGLLVLITSLMRLVRFLNKGREILQTSRTALVLPLGAESLAAALGSALLSSAVVWISKDVKDNTGKKWGKRSSRLSRRSSILQFFHVNCTGGSVADWAAESILCWSGERRRDRCLARSHSTPRCCVEALVLAGPAFLSRQQETRHDSLVQAYQARSATVNSTSTSQSASDFRSWPCPALSSCQTSLAMLRPKPRGNCRMPSSEQTPSTRSRS